MEVLHPVIAVYVHRTCIRITHTLFQITSLNRHRCWSMVWTAPSTRLWHCWRRKLIEYLTITLHDCIACFQDKFFTDWNPETKKRTRWLLRFPASCFQHVCREMLLSTQRRASFRNAPRHRQQQDRNWTSIRVTIFWIRAENTTYVFQVKNIKMCISQYFRHSIDIF